VNLGLSTPCGSCGAPDHCDGVCWQGAGYPGWTWIANGPTNVPSPGDMVAYHDCGSEEIGPSGHVGIFVSGDASSFQAFTQNWAGEYCQVVSHDYSCVVGWQHPGVSIAPASRAPSPCPTCEPCSVCQGLQMRLLLPGGLDLRWRALLPARLARAVDTHPDAVLGRQPGHDRRRRDPGRGPHGGGELGGAPAPSRPGTGRSTVDKPCQDGPARR
jgi:hypothetical protein